MAKNWKRLLAVFLSLFVFVSIVFLDYAANAQQATSMTQGPKIEKTVTIGRDLVKVNAIKFERTLPSDTYANNQRNRAAFIRDSAKPGSKIVELKNYGNIDNSENFPDHIIFWRVVIDSQEVYNRLIAFQNQKRKVVKVSYIADNPSGSNLSVALYSYDVVVGGKKVTKEMIGVNEGSHLGNVARTLTGKKTIDVKYLYIHFSD